MLDIKDEIITIVITSLFKCVLASLQNAKYVRVTFVFLLTQQQEKLTL